jgi:hypothetical protein
MNSLGTKEVYLDLQELFISNFLKKNKIGKWRIILHFS